MMLGMPGSGPGQRRGPGGAVSPHGGRGSAPAGGVPGSRDPRARASGADAGPGVLDRPSPRPDTGATQPGGPVGWSTATLRRCPMVRAGFNGVLYAPQRARTTRPGAEPDSTLKGHEPRRASPGTGPFLVVVGYADPAGSRDQTRDASLRVRRAMPGRNRVISPKAPQA